MHIVMVSDHETTGGAAIATSRLAEGLLGAGQSVTRLVCNADWHEHTWSTYRLASLPLARSSHLPTHIIRRVATARGRQLWDRRIALQDFGRVLSDLSPDVINIHNIHGASWVGWSNALISICMDHAPTVWTLHDMWSFTGRCAYSYDCRKFLLGCDSACPTPNEYPALAPRKIADAWLNRRRLLEQHPGLVAVAPSHWLEKEALTGLWREHRVDVIPYGLQLSVYRPLERRMAHQALGIETPGPVLLVAAHSLDERRKGGDFLLKALNHLAHRPITLLTLGAGHLPIQTAGIYVHSLGYVDHERTKVLAYNAADALVHPAPVDNLPNVVMEAIACGTPVIAFPIGGVVDMVRPGQTGWLARQVMPEALAEIIDRALDDLRAGVDFRASCRSISETEYSADLQTRRYLDLFASLLDAQVKTDPDFKNILTHEHTQMN